MFLSRVLCIFRAFSLRPSNRISESSTSTWTCVIDMYANLTRNWFMFCLGNEVLAYLDEVIPHDDVMKWIHFPRYWPFVRGIHRSAVNAPHKDQGRGALVFPLICAWTSGWVNNRHAGDLRRHRAHYDVTVMGQWTMGRVAVRHEALIKVSCAQKALMNASFWVHALLWSLTGLFPSA